VTQVNASAAGPDASIDPKVIFDFDASYKLTNGIKLGVGANNMFNIYPNKLPTAAGQRLLALQRLFALWGERRLLLRPSQHVVLIASV
jgi:iron complex outermembrane receptor protein